MKMVIASIRLPDFVGAMPPVRRSSFSAVREGAARKVVMADAEEQPKSLPVITFICMRNRYLLDNNNIFL